MKLKVRICRAAKVPTGFLKGCVGAEMDALPDQVYAKILENFAPLAPGFDFYIESSKSLVTKEVMAFNIQAKNTPFACGMSTADMLDPIEIARVDGAIESELNRMGISSTPGDYEYRVLYEVEE